MRNIILDTDGRQEALPAIQAALNDPSVTVRAITTVAAGLTARDAARNVLSLPEFSRPEAPEVFIGTERPLTLGSQPLTLPGHLLTPTAPPAPRTSTHAVNAILSLAAKGNTELITLGPLTNVALAFAKNRTAMNKLTRITLLGGMIFHGDVGPMSEYNFYTDPESADLVLKSGMELLLLPLEVGNFLQRIELALHPEKIVKSYSSHTRIELDGEFTRGANINDVRDRNRKEFISQNTVLHPFNCTLVADNAIEEITMEV